MIAIKLLIVDDHEVVRRGLISLFELYPEIVEIINEARSEEEAVAKALEFQPDVIIMDVKLSLSGDLKKGSGISACKRIKEKLPETKVIMLSSFAEEDSIYESIMAGASGYLLKGLEGKELINSIQMVSEGKSLLDPNITAKVFSRMKAMSKKQTLLSELTNQEKELLKLLAQGKNNKEIAEIMLLGEKTVRNYVSQILSKLGVGNRIEAASLVHKNKLFDT